MTRARTIADYGKQTADLATQAELDATLFQGVPHIIPGVLYPAVAGKLLDGSTSHSGAYGTAQADGYSYYYTDIKGSKPIKDPRIGAHFGSQRHPCTSLQKLEQETATHGKDTYSIDGREWMRIQGHTDRPVVANDSNGNYINCGNAGNARAVELEITGYFNKANISGFTNSYAGRKWESCWVNGTEVTTDTTFVTTATTPLGGRYVSAGSLIPIEMGTVTSPQITTIKLVHDSDGESNLYAIELIAQDTTSTATKSQIQIPSQNVVSYGKKFTVSGTPHYDPFNGFTNSSSLHSAFVDTATSLGLSSAPGSSASWAISSTNNIRPYNGMRVVKWVDSSGTIKTSVTAMPPNAQNIKTQVNAEITTPSATNTTTTPNMSDDAVDHSLSEVAKTYHWREFGNGAANTGGYVDYYADATMLKDVVDDIGYVMDDGLTSLVGNDVRAASDQDLRPEDDAGDDFWASTFIGTGVSIKTTTYAAGTYHIACNLPYGTHVLKVERDADTTPDMYLDGLTYTDVSGGTYGCLSEITFYQPKMPPIPEDAVVISDYMLMADFVRQAAPTKTSAPWNEEHTIISKGVRMCGPSRDLFYEETTGGHVFSFDIQNTGPGGFYCASNATSSGGQNNYVQLPAFGTDYLLANHSGGGIDLYVNGTDVAHTTTTGHSFIDISYPDSATTLGLNIFKGQGLASDYSPYVGPKGFMIVSPTHTSSHYQTFETPFLHELVGGDRNMEQTNLVVTPDGKTWDELRDTSYIGNVKLQLSADVGEVDYNVKVILDECRGFKTDSDKAINTFNKEFAIAYDRIICLVDGEYRVHFNSICMAGNNQNQISIYVNDNIVSKGYNNNTTWGKAVAEACLQLKRGDYIYINGGYWDNGGVGHSGFYIEKMK